MQEHAFELFEHFMMQIKARSGGTISFKLAAEIASAASSGMMAEVYSQINPEVIGTDYRDLSIATKYGERLDKKYQNLKPGALQRLVREYPSHDFVIDLEEARELFNRVDVPSPALYNAVLRTDGINMMSPSTTKGIVKMSAVEPTAEPETATDVEEPNDQHAEADRADTGAAAE